LKRLRLQKIERLRVSFFNEHGDENTEASDYVITSAYLQERRNFLANVLANDKKYMELRPYYDNSIGVYPIFNSAIRGMVDNAYNKQITYSPFVRSVTCLFFELPT
jgi:hypothetical protein